MKNSTLFLLLLFCLALLLAPTLATKIKAAPKGDSAREHHENNVNHEHPNQVQQETKAREQFDENHRDKAHHPNEHHHKDDHSHTQYGESRSNHHHDDHKRKHKHEERKPHHHVRPIQAPLTHCLDCLNIVRKLSTWLQDSQGGSVAEVIQRNCLAFKLSDAACTALIASPEKLENLLSSQPTPELVCAHLKLCQFPRNSHLKNDEGKSKHASDDDDDDDDEKHKSKHANYGDDDDDDDDEKHKSKHANDDDDDDEDDKHKRSHGHAENSLSLEDPTNCDDSPKSVFCVESCDQLRQQEARFWAQRRQHSHLSWWIQRLRNHTIARLNGGEEYKEQEEQSQLQIPATCSNGTWSCSDGLVPENTCFSNRGCRFPRPQDHMCKHHKWVPMGHCKKRLIAISLFGIILFAIFSLCYLFYRSVHSRRNDKTPVFDKQTKYSSVVEDEDDEISKGISDKEKLIQQI